MTSCAAITFPHRHSGEHRDEGYDETVTTHEDTHA